MNRLRVPAFLGLAIMIVGLIYLTPSRSSAAEWEFPKEWFFHDNDDQRAKHEALLGKPMPPLDLTDWRGEALTSEDLKGKILVVDFWATWCGPCIRAMPKNEALAAKYKDQGVMVIGVCTSSGQEKMDQVLERTKVTYPNGKDPTLAAEKGWSVMWYPTYAVVDRKGNVRAIGLMPDKVEDVVKKLLAE